MKTIWLAYSEDYGNITDGAIFETEVEALRHAVKSGFMKVVELEYGESLYDATHRVVNG